MPTDTSDKKFYHLGYGYSKYGNNPQTGSSGQYAWGRLYDSRTYVQARKRGKGFVNPKSYSRTIYDGNYYRMPCNWRFYGSGFWNWGNQFDVPWGAGAIAVPSFDGSLSSKAILDARLKVKDQDTNFGVALAESGRTAKLLASSATKIAGEGTGLLNALNGRDRLGVKLSPAFAEMRRTGSFIADSAITLAKAAIAVKKGNFKKAAGLLGVPLPKKLPPRSKKSRQNRSKVAENWLEFQYGWKPLMSDMYGAVEHVAKRNTENPDRYGTTVRSFRGSTSVVKSTLNDVVGGMYIYTDQVQTNSFGAFVRLDYTLKNGNMAELASTGATNPLEIAWELVPFSFVVDWFAPIGKFCSLLDAESGWEFRSGSLSTRQETKLRISFRPRYLAGQLNKTVNGGGQTRCLKFIRTVYGAPPIPRFYFKSPVSPTHLANATALIAVAFGGRYR